MPAPAAASPLPLTILVLAWDEAAPAVRTLIEAAPGLTAAANIGPLLVLTPPAPAPPAPALAGPGEPAASAPTLPPPTIPAASTAPVVSLPDQPTETAVRPETLPAALEAWETAVAARPAGWTAVRVTRLAYPEPSPVSRFASLAPTAFPAAPYLGATPPAASVAAGPVAPEVPPPASSAVASSPADGSITQPADAEPQPAAPPAPELYTFEEALAPDLEADLLPTHGTQEAHPLAPAQPVGSGASFSVADEATTMRPDASDTLSLDRESLAEPITAAIPVADPDGTLASPSIDAAPVSAAPAEAEDLLADEPLLGPAPEAEPAAVASPPLLPVVGHYSAPDLNTQVIRYARFAVPAALAEGPFTVIYAPAWPTWLAALELRQRTGYPLVLHLQALAAGRAPADTAAGWPAEIQRQALRQADLVLTETYALARRLRRELGLANSTVRVVPAADGSAVARALRRARRREVVR